MGGDPFRECDVLHVETPTLTADHHECADRRSACGQAHAEQFGGPHGRCLGHESRMRNHAGEVRLGLVIAHHV